MPATLDLDTPRALIAIAGLKGFSRAAEQLGRSQVAISLQIALLESLTGHALLQRSRGRVHSLLTAGCIAKVAQK